MFNPAESDGSFFVALAKAEQKGPGLFFLQQDMCCLPAHEPHDVPENPHAQYNKRLINWEASCLNPLPHSQLIILRKQGYSFSGHTRATVSLLMWELFVDYTVIHREKSKDDLRCALPIPPKIHQVSCDQIQDSIDPNPGTFILAHRKTKGNM